MFKPYSIEVLFQKLYTLMFNAATDALADLKAMNFGAAENRLLSAQPQAEELYITQGGPPAGEDDAP